MKTPKIELTEKEKEIKRIKRLIRKGILPRRMFAKGPVSYIDEKGVEHTQEGLERIKDPRHPWTTCLSWRTLDTLHELTKDL